MVDSSFEVNRQGLTHALDLLEKREFPMPAALPPQLAERGIGEEAALDLLAPLVFEGAARLDLPHAFAHMDPPTPWVSWATTLWNARLNQNLLHPASAPFGRAAERQALAWLAPHFGMEGGHMTPGSTLANLTALWAARDITGARRVIASEAAHLSIAKSAKILGLKFETVTADEAQRMDAAKLPGDLSDAILVLTAGTTSAGAIDPLSLCGQAAWTHVDAAWAGPLVFSRTHAARLAGMERADSVAVSAHKWLFQPKESALVFFRDLKRAHDAISFGGNYLATPNIGVQGSHGAVAIPLLATLLAWGRAGLAERIDRCMTAAATLADVLAGNPQWLLFAEPETGVVLFRPAIGNCDDAFARLPSGLASTTRIGSEAWLRCVAANPNVDIAAVTDAILKAI
ncbi:MAG: pyridoxal-dependent decarboxylase [Rhizomicrobium sp.]